MALCGFQGNLYKKGGTAGRAIGFHNESILSPPPGRTHANSKRRNVTFPQGHHPGDDYACEALFFDKSDPPHTVSKTTPAQGLSSSKRGRPGNHPASFRTRRANRRAAKRKQKPSETFSGLAELAGALPHSPAIGDTIGSADFLPEFAAPGDPVERPQMEKRKPIQTEEDLRDLHREVDSHKPLSPEHECNLTAEEKAALWEELELDGLAGEWPEQELSELKKLVVAFCDVFGFPNKPLHFTTKVKCKLTPLPGAPVPHATPSSLMPEQREWLRGELERLQEQVWCAGLRGVPRIPHAVLLSPKRGLARKAKRDGA